MTHTTLIEKRRITAQAFPDGPTAWHALSVQEAARLLDADLTLGLTEADAARRRARWGPNALAGVRRRSPFVIFAHQFQSLVVGLLVAAGGVALTLGERVEAIAILIVIVLNAIIGFITEWKAEQAVHSLRKEAVPVAHVLRDGEQRQIPAADLVPGDVVVVVAGGRIPADGRLIDAVQLRVEESALTGESVSVTKTVDAVTEEGAPIGDRVDMVYMGTAVADGHGRFIVTATGPRTEMGAIGTLVADAGVRRSPIEAKLARLGRVLLAVVLVLSAIIVLAGWLRGIAFLTMLEVGISLAIAAVPEGLPAVTTMTLALGMRRMARRHALVRRLPAVEALGSTTVICSDKTGTLTRNEMTVRALYVDARRIEVAGSGYSATGEFLIDGIAVDADDAVVALALRIATLCNDARLDRRKGETVVLGDPTEAALIVAGEKGGLDRAALEREYPRVAELPFSSETKRMATVHRAPDGKLLGYVKGSPGTLLAASARHMKREGAAALTDADRERWEEINREFGGAALRVLGLAYRELPDDWSPADLGRDLTYVGQIGMVDPPRDGVRETIATCRGAGIRTIMITGDQPVTAAEIAKQLGIDHDAGGKTLRTVHGRELERLDSGGWQRIVSETAVFARVSPRHKLKIVEALQQSGNIVAMTGDGVNDAPALKQADIGVAMGIKGTEVAKDTADMIITDDNFATIVAAVEQGRVVVHNILRFIHYLFSCNFAEVVTVFAAIMLGWPLPLAATQILWLNMVTDVFPALALALEPSAPDTMRRPPRNPSEPLLTRSFAILIGWQGLLIAGVTLGAFYIGREWDGGGADGSRRATTIAFMTLALAQVLHVFNARSRTRSAVTSRLFSNGWLWSAVALCVLLQLAAVYAPWLQVALHTAPPGAGDWMLILIASLIPVAVVELFKAGQARRQSGRLPDSPT